MQLLGYPAMLSCGRDPVKPVSWTFQHSPESAVNDVDFSERYGFRNSTLIIYRVKAADSGTYNCTEAAGERHTIQLTVIGKLYTLLSFKMSVSSFVCSIILISSCR